MPITRLGIVNPAANTDSSLVNFTGAHLISVVASNKASVATPVTKVTIWVVPANATVASQYAYICSNLIIAVGQSFETFRFAVNAGDTLYVRSSTNTTSFFCSGIPQEDDVLPVNLAQTFTNKVIRGADNTVYLDSGTTAERRVSAETGYVRFNTETEVVEVKTDSGWERVGSDDLYTPTTTADWDSVPSTVAAALDELASRLRALE
jgi:hypothetical protein